ncbi:MAG TPA: hypothetical protein VFO34_05655 [Candidatus Acidoferrales bacterium]|nr:hypothetical protein [Candidatus Acidoferrales bacterium]
MPDRSEIAPPTNPANAAKLEIALALTRLDRKDLSSLEIEEIARKKELLRDYRVKRALAFHPHVPRTVALRLVRELYTMDLMRLALAPASPADLRTVAEQALIARLSQLALGEKIALARQASARVVSALLIEGHRKIVAPALDNPRLTESQILKVLSKEKIAPPVMTAICHHTKWASLATVRMALVRHRQTPLDAAAKFLRLMTHAELQTIATLRSISAALRLQLEGEVERRQRAT